MKRHLPALFGQLTENAGKFVVESHQDYLNFKLNPNPTVEVKTIGNEEHPIVIIDKLMVDPQCLVDYAKQKATFKPAAKGENYYPGARAPAPKEYAVNLVNSLRPLIEKYFRIDATRLEAARCAYSMVTSSPENLTLTQRLAHFDTVHEGQVAAVHYLCDPSHGGTAFYRQRSTGFESVTRNRSQQYFDALTTDITQHGEPDQSYLNASDQLFEQTACVDARFDRIVVYKSTMLHSGLINFASGLSTDPQEGRLTTTLFARFSMN